MTMIDAPSTPAALQTQRIAAKIYLKNPAAIELDRVVTVFHQWIQQHGVPDHQPIDVADYKHVVEGPGVVLISHEANIHFDMSLGKPGLFYIRKQPLPGEFGERLEKIIGYAAMLAGKLEAQDAFSPKLAFGTDRLLIRFNDRLLAPPDAETYEQVAPAVQKVVSGLTGSPATVRRMENPYRPFEVEVDLGKCTLARLAGSGN